MKTTEQTTLQAFLIALAQLETPLSEELKQEIHEMGSNLATDSSAAITKIPSLVEKEDELSQLYQTARLNLNRQYQTQERDKLMTYTPSVPSISSLNNLENIAAEMLLSDNFQAKAQQIVRKFKDSQDSFLNSLQMAVSVTNAKADLKAIAVLQALEFRPLTKENLAYTLEMNQEQVEQIVQRLWQERKIDTTRGGTLRKMLPFLRPKKKPDQIDNVTTYLTLTSLGYFYLHPIIQAA